MNSIITFILAHEDQPTSASFIKHIKGIISQVDDTPNFFLIYRAKLLLSILQNYKEGSKFRLLVHLDIKRAKETEVAGGKIANELKTSGMFAGQKFDFTTREPEVFKGPLVYFTIDENGNVIHNASEMDSSIVDRMILYEIKNGKAVGEVMVNTKESNGPAEKIAILTAMDNEMKEVKKYLAGFPKKTLEDKQKQIFYEIYSYENEQKKKFEIYLKISGKQNFSSASATSDVITNLAPNFLFYIGIAGKLKDVNIGDVVIADRVENYEPAKVEDDDYKTRIYQGHADDYLLNLASSIITDDENIWQQKIKVLKHENIINLPIDFKGRIATGEKVLGSITAKIYEQIRHDCSESLAVECEGGGFYHACNLKNSKGLLIRGISDKLKDKGFDEEFNSQSYAASCASSFLFELINRL